MATLGDLKSRIEDELLKRNLNTQIAQHIARAIEFYAGRRFWFNTGTVTGAPVAPDGDSYVDLPAGTRLIDKIRIGTTTLRLRDPKEMDDWLAAAGGGTTPEPYDYSVEGDRIRLYPRASGTVALTVTGTFDQPALTNDAASNAWTNEGADLIAARVRMTMNRDVIRNADGVALAKDAIREAEDDLDMKTMRRVGSGRVKGYL